MLRQELEKRAAAGNPIRVGVSGAGWIGSGFVAQVAQMRGITVPVLADQDTGAAFRAFVATGVEPGDIVEVDAPGRASDALWAG
jgi:predicted homoserine dehydrogenase-like protein